MNPLTLLRRCAAALLAFSLFAGSAQAEQTLRIGYQKFNSLNILKGTGALERALAPEGIRVAWYEFAAGPQLLEALSTGAIDLGHAADAPSVFAQAAGKPVVYLAAEQPYPKGIGFWSARIRRLATSPVSRDSASPPAAAGMPSICWQWPCSRPD